MSASIAATSAIDHSQGNLTTFSSRTATVGLSAPTALRRLQLENGAAHNVRAVYAGSPLACASLLAMPTVDLTDDEHAAITALIRRAIEEDRISPRPRIETI